MKSVRDIGNIEGKTIFLRADFNVPVKDSVITDDFRIKKTLPLIDFIQKNGGRLVIGSHFEGEGGSLKPVFEYLKKDYQIVFLEDFYPEGLSVIKEALDSGNIVLLDNLRKYKEEKENSDEYAKHLSSFADFFVNEAFSSAHRRHASVIGIPKYIPGFSGFVFEEEIKELSRVLKPTHPFLFILGGAKFETKLPLVRKIFNIADYVFIGGALANDFIKAQGLSVGSSLLSSDGADVRDFLTPKLILPSDVLVRDESGAITKKKITDINITDYIVDVGPETMERVDSCIQSVKSILWNGPLGNYELGFKEATLSLAKSIAGSDTVSVVGGGDTIASIAELNLSDKFTFISTGGGAMLDFLANETLPGIEALNQH